MKIESMFSKKNTMVITSVTIGKKTRRIIKIDTFQGMKNVKSPSFLNYVCISEGEGKEQIKFFHI